MTEKKFFRVRLADRCPVAKKMINGLMLTRQWQMKVGEAGDFAKFPDVEAQAVVKQGNGFVPVGKTPGVTNGSDEGSGSAPTPAQNAEGAKPAAEGAENPPDFNGMTVEQLKNYLAAKGVPPSELRNTAKPELIERAEFIWSQNQ